VPGPPPILQFDVSFAPHERAGFLAGVRKFVDTLLIEHKCACRMEVKVGGRLPRLAECGRSDKGLWVGGPRQPVAWNPQAVLDVMLMTALLAHQLIGA